MGGAVWAARRAERTSAASQVLSLSRPPGGAIEQGVGTGGRHIPPASASICPFDQLVSFKALGRHLRGCPPGLLASGWGNLFTKLASEALYFLGCNVFGVFFVSPSSWAWVACCCWGRAHRPAAVPGFLS